MKDDIVQSILITLIFCTFMFLMYSLGQHNQCEEVSKIISASDDVSSNSVELVKAICQSK